MRQGQRERVEERRKKREAVERNGLQNLEEGEEEIYRKCGAREGRARGDG